MSTDQPTPGPGPQDGARGASGGSPYDRPPPGTPHRQPPGNPYSDGPYGAPPPGGPGPGGPGGSGGPYGQDPSAGGTADPLAGMPPLAAPGRRLLARIIDVIIVLVPAGLLDWAAGGIHGDDFDTGGSAIGGLFTAGLGFLYEWYVTRSTGQTLGKRVLKLRDAMLADGSVPGDSAAATRALVLWLPAFCCSGFWFVIIGITVAFDRPYKQGLHDKAARTVVVQAL